MTARTAVLCVAATEVEFRTAGTEAGTAAGCHVSALSVWRDDQGAGWEWR
jgi:hypothetical protein